MVEAGRCPGAGEVGALRLTFTLNEGGPTAGEVLVARLAAVASLRDIAIVEPAIEDVVARLYTDPQQRGRDPAARRQA